jgi:hypothetical protein
MKLPLRKHLPSSPYSTFYKHQLNQYPWLLITLWKVMSVLKESRNSFCKMKSIVHLSLKSILQLKRMLFDLEMVTSIGRMKQKRENQTLPLKSPPRLLPLLPPHQTKNKSGYYIQMNCKNPMDKHGWVPSKRNLKKCNRLVLTVLHTLKEIRLIQRIASISSTIKNSIPMLEVKQKVKNPSTKNLVLILLFTKHHSPFTIDNLC